MTTGDADAGGYRLPDYHNILGDFGVCLSSNLLINESSLRHQGNIKPIDQR
jgi:hypothetical protein